MSATVEFKNVECIRESAKAILCRVNGREVWIPQSLVHDDSEVFAKGHQGKLVIPEWFAEQEGIE